MANVNTISFGPSQQDLQAQQIDLARRQQIADALRAQSLAPIESQMVSGRVVPTSPWLGAIKLAQAGLANQAQSQNAADEAALGQASAQRQAAALRALAPAGTFDQSQEPIQLGNGLTEEPPTSKVDQATKSRWAKILAANSYDPALAKKLLENELTTPEETRNLIAQGIDPTAFGKARLGKEVAGGVTNVAAGTSVFNPQTGQFVAAAPDFANGVQGGFGPNGQPQVSRIAGSDVLPQIAGEKARAEAAGRAGYNTITVNTPNGPVLLTEEQAAQLAGGGRQPQANAPVNFQASNGVSINLSGKTPQQIIQAAQASRDPQVMQAVNEWMRSGGQQPQQMGIPLQSEAQKELQVGQARNTVELAKDLAKNAQSPEAQQRIADAQSVVNLLQEASPYIQSATGSTAGNLRDAALGLVGQSTNAGRDAARLAAIGGQLVSKQPKMSGPQSDKDVLLYKEMAGRIGDPSVPSDVKAAAADTILRLNQKYLQQNQSSMATEALKQTKGGAKPASIDDLLNKYGGGR